MGAVWTCGSRDCPGHSDRNHVCQTGVWYCNRNSPPCPGHSKKEHRCQTANNWTCYSKKCPSHSAPEHVCQTGVWYCNRIEPPCPGHSAKIHECKDTDASVEAFKTGKMTMNPWTPENVVDQGWDVAEGGYGNVYMKKVRHFHVWVHEEHLLVKKNIWIDSVKKLNSVGKNPRDIKKTAFAFQNDIKRKKDIARYIKYFLQSSFAPTAEPIFSDKGNIDKSIMEDVIRELPEDPSRRVFLDPKHRSVFMNIVMKKCTEVVLKVIPADANKSIVNVIIFKPEYYYKKSDLSKLADDWIFEATVRKVYEEKKSRGEKINELPEYFNKISNTLVGFVQGPSNNTMYFESIESVNYLLVGSHIECSEGKLGTILASKEFRVIFPGFNKIPQKYQNYVRKRIADTYNKFEEIVLDYEGNDQANANLRIQFEKRVTHGNYYGIHDPAKIEKSEAEQADDENDVREINIALGNLVNTYIEYPDGSVKLAFEDTQASLGAAIANVIIHEMGHGLGLDYGFDDGMGHVDNANNIMWDFKFGKPTPSLINKGVFEYTVGANETFVQILDKWKKGELHPYAKGGFDCEVEDALHDAGKTTGEVYPGEVITFKFHNYRNENYNIKKAILLADRTFNTKQIERIKETLFKGFSYI